MLLHPLKPLVPLATAVKPAVFNLPAFTIHGGAAAAGTIFNEGLAKTRLEGLAYSTVTTLMIGTALSLFSSTPKKLESVPSDPENARIVKFNNRLKIVFVLCSAISVALGSYATTIFTLMSIYSKTALGMGLQDEYLEFFEKCAPYRKTGFRAFLGTLLVYKMSWVLALMLSYEGDIRWWFALPAAAIGLVCLFHLRTIMSLASALLYS